MTMQPNTPRPNFFIVGSPKTGTSSMHYYLRQHSEVFMPIEKEIAYFQKDLQSPVMLETEEEYLSFFKNAGDAKAIGEATTQNFFSELAAGELQKFNKDAKIIFMLRQPVDFMFSLHNQRYIEGIETEKDFTQALALEPLREKGQALPPQSRFSKEYLLYRNTASYPKHITRFLKYFPASQIHFIFLEDLKESVEQTFIELCRFLEISETEEIDFQIQNERREWRFETLRPLLLETPANNARHYMPRFLREGLKKIFLTKQQQRPTLPKSVYNSLTQEFFSQIDETSELSGRDLSHWKNLKPENKEE